MKMASSVQGMSAGSGRVCLHQPGRKARSLVSKFGQQVKCGQAIVGARYVVVVGHSHAQAGGRGGGQAAGGDSSSLPRACPTPHLHHPLPQHQQAAGQPIPHTATAPLASQSLLPPPSSPPAPSAPGLPKEDWDAARQHRLAQPRRGAVVPSKDGAEHAAPHAGQHLAAGDRLRALGHGADSLRARAQGQGGCSGAGG